SFGVKHNHGLGGRAKGDGGVRLWTVAYPIDWTCVYGCESSQGCPILDSVRSTNLRLAYG
ncbi:MAG: hypothetical protein P8182_19945, partial [Deltaproteobacteria bacterium]